MDRRTRYPSEDASTLDERASSRHGQAKTAEGSSPPPEGGEGAVPGEATQPAAAPKVEVHYETIMDAKALDALGRYEEALHYYRRFVTRWQDADPHLQPQVEEARQRIRELEAELS